MRKRHSRFFSLFAVLLVTAFVPAGRAQTGTLTTVLASPSGPWIEVDGTVYFNAMSAFWPVGSVHTLSIPAGTGYSYGLNGRHQWQFQQWEWSNGSSSSTTIQVIGNIGSTRFTAVFTTQYLFTPQVACNPAPCTGVPGTILVNGSRSRRPANLARAGFQRGLNARLEPRLDFRRLAGGDWCCVPVSVVFRHRERTHHGDCDFRAREDRQLRHQPS